MTITIAFLAFVVKIGLSNISFLAYLHVINNNELFGGDLTYELA